MNKNIVILDGLAWGKTEFIETVMKNKFWVWNTNFHNLLSFIAHKLSWAGSRNKEYYNFLNELEVLSNKYFNSEENYIHSMIDKFLVHDKAQILFLHNIKSEFAKKLQEAYPNCYSVFISNDDNVNDSYTTTLNCQKENYKQLVLNTVESFQKDLTESEENSEEEKA